jgi:hypothetical protein
MSKKGISLTFAAVAMMMAVSAQAGYYYEAVTKTSSDQQRGEQTTRVKVWVEGESTRIEYQEGSGMGGFEAGNYIISTDAGDNMLMVDPEEKTATVFNMGATMNMAAAAMEGLGGMVQMEFTDFYVEPGSEESGGDLLGYDTRRVRYKSGYTMKMSMFGRNMDQVIKMSNDMWVTDEIDARAFSAWLRPDKMMKGMFEGLDELMEQQFSQMAGTPLKAVIETVTTDNEGKSSNSRMVTEVTELREENVDPAIFEIPDDYERRDPIAELQAGNGENQEKDNPMDALKGLFGRDR